MCKEPGCRNKLYYNGYCRKHYLLSIDRVCVVPGCNKPAYRGLYCNRHYYHKEEKINSPTSRTCLKCGKDFPSEGPFNRLCEPCKRSNGFIDEKMVSESRIRRSGDNTTGLLSADC